MSISAPDLGRRHVAERREGQPARNLLLQLHLVDHSLLLAEYLGVCDGVRLARAGQKMLRGSVAQRDRRADSPGEAPQRAPVDDQLPIEAFGVDGSAHLVKILACEGWPRAVPAQESAARNVLQPDARAVLHGESEKKVIRRATRPEDLPPVAARLLCGALRPEFAPVEHSLRCAARRAKPAIRE